MCGVLDELYLQLIHGLRTAVETLSNSVTQGPCVRTHLMKVPLGLSEQSLSHLEVGKTKMVEWSTMFI